MKKKFLLILTTLIFLSSIIFTAHASTSKNEFNVDDITKYKELNNLKTEYANAYDIGNDQIVYQISTKKIHYKDKAGIWKDIDNEIIQTDQKDTNYKYKNKQNDFLTLYGLNEKGKVKTKISKDKYNIDFTLISDSNSSLDKNNKVQANDNEYLNQINNNNNSVIYKNAFPNSDIIYTVDGDVQKEDIVLYGKPDFNELTYTFKTENLKFKKELREYKGINEDTKDETTFQKEVGIFFDPDTNEEIFTLKDFFMMDTNEKSSADLKWDVSQNGDEYTLKFYLDEQFLNDSSIKFPVIIDPTVQGSSVTFDTYASSANPTTNYYLSTYLRTGKDTPYGKRRTFIKWTLPSIPFQDPINWSRAFMKKYSSSGSINLNAVYLTTNWTSSTLTWNNSPNYSEAHAAWNSTAASDNWYYLDISDIVRRWYCGMYSNYGIKIYDNNESSTSVWATFLSSDYSGDSSDPYLYIYVYTGNTDWARYDYGYMSNSIPIANNLSQYYDQFYGAMGAWNTSGAHCNIYENSQSLNKMQEYYSSTDGNFAYYQPYTFLGNTVNFDINLNTYSLTNKEWNYMAQSVLVHELGHALWLADRPGTNNCIMGQVDSNAVFTPKNSDIAGVNAKW